MSWSCRRPSFIHRRREVWGHGRRLAVLVIVGALAPTAATTAERSKYGKIRFGPVYITPNLTVLAGVDNNVYNSPTGVADESVRITPSLTVVLPVTSHARLKGVGGVVPNYFHKESSERHIDAFGGGSAEVDIGPLSFSAGAGRARYRQRFSLEIDERILRHESNKSVGASLRIARRISASASQTSLTFTFDPTAVLHGEPIGLILDRDTVTRRFEIALPITRKTSLAPFLDLVEDRFLRSPSGVPARVPSQRYGVAVEFGELAFIVGNVTVGVRHYGASEGVPPYDGLFLDVSAGMPFVLKTRLQLSSHRDVTYSALRPVGAAVRTTYVSSTHRAEILYELPWRLHGRSFVGYSEASYLQPSDSEVTSAPPSRDHAWLVGGALLRRLGDHVSVGAIVQRENRAGALTARTYVGTVYGLTGEVHF